MRAAVKVKSPEKRARIGERIKIAATSAGMTLKDLAERVGTSPALIYQYVRGITNVPPELLDRVAAACQVNRGFFDPDRDTRSAMALPAEAGPDGVPPRIDRERIAADVRRLQQLADALDQPRRNVSGLVSVLHEMLALARVTGDRLLESRVEARLGTLHNDTGDFAAARHCLVSASDTLAELGSQEARLPVQMELARGLAGSGALDPAIETYRAVADAAPAGLRWRALIEVSGLLWAQYRSREALESVAEAAVAIEGLDDEAREAEGMPALMARLAKMALEAGHHTAALPLWRAAAAAWGPDGPLDVYLRCQIGAADCCLQFGRLGEARQRLDQMVAVARCACQQSGALATAHARLATLAIAAGSVDQAREQARVSLRVALRLGRPQECVTALLAQAAASLAAGQDDEALATVDEAVKESLRACLPADLARARLLRARILLRRHACGEAPGSLDEARAEAARSVEAASRPYPAIDAVAARIVLGECLEAAGDDSTAAEQYRTALELLGTGALPLDDLMGVPPAPLPSLLTTGPTDLATLFAGREMRAPALAWRASYLLGRIECRTGATAVGFSHMRQAESALSDLLSGLSVEEAARMAECSPEVLGLYQNLERFALTEAERAEAVTIVRGAPWLKRAGDAPGTAVHMG